MPFPDEVTGLQLVPSNSGWATDFHEIAHALECLEVAKRKVVEHIGSTAVPGLVAKDVIDVQVRVDVLDEHRVVDEFASIGFRRRLEAWNNIEPTRVGPVPKLVFAPPVGHRRCNVHVRHDGSAGARDALLFRDFLRAEPGPREAWGEVKLAIVREVPNCDLFMYGQIKQAAWKVLMHAADYWAAGTAWRPPPLA
jgi:dephospho-CoA kinase